MQIDKRLFIKEGLSHNNNFVIENSDVLTIYKNIISDFNNFFEFIFIEDDQTSPTIFLCDRIIYDPIKYTIDILNTRSLSVRDQVRDQKTGSCKINECEIVSLYSFGENKILAVINKEK